MTFQNNRPNNADLYFEAHITIDPVFDSLRGEAETLAIKHRFRLAKLLMKKESSEDLQNSILDTFMTSHSKSLSDIKERTTELVRALQMAGFNVRRYKIEDTVLDSRTFDILNLLNKSYQ